MLKIYGSMQCPDCVKCKKDLDKAGVTYEYLDFGDSLRNLKVFLNIREKDPILAEVKREGKIGIPCIVKEDGAVTLNWEGFM